MVGGTLFAFTILLRLGLLAYFVTLLFVGLLSRGPAVTLALDAWTVGMSFVTLLVAGAIVHWLSRTHHSGVRHLEARQYSPPRRLLIVSSR